MISTSDFRKHAHDFVDWMADYFEGVEKYPVKSQVKPGDIIKQLTDSPPENGEPINKIFKGKTWKHVK